MPAVAHDKQGLEPEMRYQWLLILACAVIFSFFYNVLRLTGPVFILLVYDRVLPSGSSDTLLSLFLFVAAFFLLMGLVDYSRRRILARLGAQFQEVMEKYILVTTEQRKFYLPGQRKPATGLNEIDNLRSFLHSSTLITILDFLWAPMFLCVVFYFHPILGWTVVCGLLGLLGLSWIKTSGLRHKAVNSGTARDEVRGLKDMILTSREVIRAQGVSPSINKRWLRARVSSRDKSIELADWHSWFSVFSRQIRSLLQYSVLAVGAYLVLNDELSLGAMIASMFLAVRVLVPVEQFVQELPTIHRARTSWQSLRRLLSGRVRHDHSELSAMQAPHLKLSGVSARSALTLQPVLKFIELDIAPGMVIEINGLSGAGKTLLAQMVMGIGNRDSGKVLFAGKHIESTPWVPGKNPFGYLPSSVSFIAGTVEENIAGFDVSADTADVVAAAKLACVHEFIEGLPQRYQTPIDPGNIQFSEGQRYLLGVARALFCDPAILIIDEPDGLITKGDAESILGRLVMRQLGHGHSLLVLSRERCPVLSPNQRYILDNGTLTINGIVGHSTKFEGVSS